MLLVSLVLTSCQEPLSAPQRDEKSPGAPSDATPSAFRAADDVGADAMERSTSPEDPLAEWTYAPDFQAFHKIWRDRFELTAGDARDANALLPYADAVAFRGASWGIDPSHIRLIPARGNDVAYDVPNGNHAALPGDPEQVKPAPELVAMVDGAAYRAGPGIRRRHAGLGLWLVGPVVARPACLACHAYEPGSVVGALVYNFSEIADD